MANHSKISSVLHLSHNKSYNKTTKDRVNVMKVLVVEDDASINQMITDYLQKHNYKCISAYSGSEAVLLLEKENFHCVILDLMLPGISGEELIHQMKAKHIPVIILSAKDSVESKVSMLQQGADDYMCKPFDLKELEARIEVQIRKSSPESYFEKSFGNLVLKPDYRSVLIEGHTQILTKHEYKILELLISNPQRAFTKKEIYEYAWEDNYYGDDKTINVHISNLRSKLAKHSKREIIETIWGIGFKLKS